MHHDELCPECFKVVGSPTRYKLVCIMGQSTLPLSVTDLTTAIGLKQPTITHHLQTLESVGAVVVKRDGNRKLYTINRRAHCFDECNIPTS